MSKNRFSSIRKSLIAFLLLVMMSAGSCYAAKTITPQLPDSLAGLSPQAIFDQANILFELHKYKKSLQLYHDIELKRYGSGPLYLNMAIAYVNLDSLGLAKYYLLRANKFQETRSQAQSGLTYVNNQLSHKSAVLPPLPWDQAMNWVQNTFGVHTFLLLSLILLNIGIFVLVGIWFLDKFKKPLKYLGIIFVTIGIISLITAKLVDYHAVRYTKGVMITKEASVMEKPAKKSNVVSMAYEGYTFTIDKKESKHNPAWYYVRMSNGLYGWIPKRDIKVL